MSKQTVYVVTEGQYSDYGITAMFSTKALAEAYIEEIKRKNESDHCDANIEEWVLDESAGNVAKDVFHCSIDLKSGEIGNQWDYREIVPNNKRVGETSIIGQFATVTSYVNAAHANKLAVKARQKWLREKAEATR